MDNAKGLCRNNPFLISKPSFPSGAHLRLSDTRLNRRKSVGFNLHNSRHKLVSNIDSKSIVPPLADNRDYRSIRKLDIPSQVHCFSTATRNLKTRFTAPNGSRSWNAQIDASLFQKPQPQTSTAGKNHKIKRPQDSGSIPHVATFVLGPRCSQKRRDDSTHLHRNRSGTRIC